MIFVAITSYLDKELVPTLKDLFEQADNPSELRVVVINKGEKVSFPGVEIYESPLDETPIQSGLKCHSKIKDEQIYFQCDPHSRFVKGWDTFIKETVNPKAIFSPAVMEYEYRDGRLFFKTNPICFQIFEFNPKDIAVTYGIVCDEFREKAFFCSNCLFCYTDWLKEVPMDERIYNWGDEVDRSIRTLMAGWKIYNTKPILYHYWKGVGDGTRGGRVRQGSEWKNKESYMLLSRKLFGTEKEKPWDLRFYENEMRRLKI